MHGVEERARPYSIFRQSLHGGLSVHPLVLIQNKTVDPIDVVGVIGMGKGELDAFEPLQEFGVAGAHASLAGDEIIQTFQLGEAQGGLHVGHAQIPAQALVDEALVRHEAEVAQAAAGLGQLLVVGDDHAAFAGGDVLVGVEAEGADIAEAAAGAAFVGLSMHLSGVFEHFQAVLTGQFQHRVDIYRQAEDVDHHDGLGAGGDAGLDLAYVHVPGDRVAVHQHRLCPASDDLADAGDDGEAGHDDFVAGADAQGVNSGIQGGGAVADGDGVTAAHALGESLFELLDKRAFGGYPTRFNAFEQVFLFVAVQQGFVDGDEVGHGGGL